MRYLIKHGSIIDSARRIATVGDLLIVDGVIERMLDMTALEAASVPLAGEDLVVIYAGGAVVAPGFIDLNAQLGEPGFEHRETIASATQAAARGGFTTVCAMPATNPCPDTPAAVAHVQAIARRTGHVPVEVIGALTQGREGRALSDMIELAEAGCVAFSDGGRAVVDAGLMRNALAYAAALGLPVLAHCEDPRLTVGWAMHEGAISTRLGLPGAPAAAEAAAIAREIALAELTGARLHFCQVSTADGVALIRAARARGAPITAEVSPHHLTLTDRWVLGSLAAHDLQAAASPPPHQQHADPQRRLPSRLDPHLLSPYDPATRISPPLRTEVDREALVEGLRDGTLDAIASGHTPRALVEKACEYGLALPGISSLETALALALTLVHRAELDLVELVARFTEGPARVLGRAPVSLRPGARADLVIFDPHKPWTVDATDFASFARHTPLQGQHLKGRVMLTMVGGQVVFRDPDFGHLPHSQPSPSRLDGLLDPV